MHGPCMCVGRYEARSCFAPHHSVIDGETLASALKAIGGQSGLCYDAHLRCIAYDIRCITADLLVGSIALIASLCHP